MNINLRIGGEIKLLARRPDGSMRLLADWFPNLVLDSGLDILGRGGTPDSYGYFDGCIVGSGNSTPTAPQTALDSPVAATGTQQNITTSGNSGAPDYIAYREDKYTFAEGEAAGNLSEVGIGPSTDTNGNHGPLFSRALIKDGAGNPTTITVLSDEVLIVHYRLHVQRDLSDATGSVAISGNTYATTSRVAHAGAWDVMYGDYVSPGITAESWAYSGAIGAITAAPSGDVAGVDSTSSIAPYNDGDHYRDFAALWPQAEANFTGGIESIQVESQLGRWQIGFSPAIPKDDTTLFQIVYRISWSRI